MDIKAFRRSLRTLEREISLALVSQTDCCGVTLAQCHALLEIAHAGTMTAMELANCLVLDKSTLSRTLSGLEAEGWIARVEDKGNRRRVLISLTAEGKSRIEKIDSLCDGLYGQMFSRMKEEECRTMIEGTALLAKALTAIRTGGISCCGSGGKA